MFKINSYLQFRNTPDGKPKVLVEGVNYNLKTVESLKKYLDFEYGDNNEVTLFEYETVANLSDCRPLLTYYDTSFGLLDTSFGDLAIVNSKYCNDGLILIERTEACIYYRDHDEICRTGKHGELIKTSYEKFNNEGESFYIGGFFFGDPAKYSKLLWDCSEEEGWEKVFELLEIK